MITLILAVALIAATIFIHYETLRLASLGATDLNVRPRMRMVMMLSAAMLSHIIHIALYAAGYLLLEHNFELGTIAGQTAGIYDDAFYFSITSYTTLGIGDIYPSGQIRLLSGIEALNGLVMITWTASMTYLHMERYWNRDTGN
ncbi:MAG: ion channel [Erythrobacter sp.]|uniref:potassium channel family protein n=1 Tax=Erythrobacter TaxID=1041 RepID=UPI0004D78CBB|nr:potassium channel family protein [Erythrobacter aurantius]KEO86603.1 membrane protein [Erythrobacter sp. JL475]